MTAAVIQDGEAAFVIIIGDDRQAFRDVSGHLAATVKRHVDHMALHLDGGLVLIVDLEAEMILRAAPVTRVVFADERGLTPTQITTSLKMDV